MVRIAKGFKVEVLVDDAVPHVCISLPDGTLIFETDKVSIIGLEKLSAVFEVAADMVSKQLGAYYQAQERQRLLRRRIPPRVGSRSRERDEAYRPIE